MNKMIHMLMGNRRFVNVNIRGKGLGAVKKIIAQFDPDVLVVTEPRLVGSKTKCSRLSDCAVQERRCSVEREKHNACFQ